MENNLGNNEYRNSLIMRTILIFVIAVLFAVIPLYYLFSIPDRALKELQASKLQNSEQMNNMKQFDEIILSLDASLKENKFDIEYTSNCGKLLQYADDKFGKSNLYQPYLIKIAKLYDQIKVTYESGRNEEINGLKEENKKLTDDLKEAINDLKVAIAEMPRP
jgi:hypothetical protein